MTTGRPGERRVLAGCTIVVSGDSRANDATLSAAGLAELDHILEDAGADVMRVVMPRPSHPAPAVLRRAVQRTGLGGADAVLFTASSASWLATAESAGVLDASRRRAEAGQLTLIAVDAQEADTLREAGLPVRCAEEPTAVALARCVIAHYESAPASLPTDSGRLEVRSGGVVVDERFIPLSRGAAALLEALFLARGRVLSRAEIGRVLPGGERSGRAVEVAIARLRESLEGVDLVQTVVKRGYRLAVSER